jgi:uncharacterized membrane-anchored protein YjiN (DUF445 family)
MTEDDDWASKREREATKKLLEQLDNDIIMKIGLETQVSNIFEKFMSKLKDTPAIMYYDLNNILKELLDNDNPPFVIDTLIDAVKRIIENDPSIVIREIEEIEEIEEEGLADDIFPNKWIYRRYRLQGGT